MFQIFSHKRRVHALPNYQSFTQRSAHQLSLAEVGGFIAFALLVMMIGR